MNKYLTEKYDWNTGTVQRVDWRAIPTDKMGKGKRIFVTSYCHQWLPLHQKLHERGRIGSPLCPVCDTHDEDHTHFQTCPHYKGPNAQDIIRGIDEHMARTEVDPVLRELVKRGMRAAIENKKTIKTSDVPGGYLPLIIDQTEIGWAHMWHARWSKRWADYQRSYAENQCGGTKTSERWLQGVIRLIWDHQHQRWIQRSKILNGEHQTVGSRGLRARVHALYGARSRLPSHYQFLFQQEEQQRLTQGNKPLRDWLRMTEPVINRALQRQNRRGGRTTGLERWMGLTNKSRRRRKMGAERRKGWETRRKQRKKQQQKIHL